MSVIVLLVCRSDEPCLWQSLSEIFHQNLGITTVSEFGNTLFADLSYTLSCESELVANLFESLFVTTDAEAFADDGYLAILEHLIEYGVQFECHRLVIHLTVGTAVLAAGHDIKHTVFLSVLEGGVYTYMVSVGHQALTYFLFFDVCRFCQFAHRRVTLVLLLELVYFVVNLIERTNLIEWESYDTSLFGNSLKNALANPPYGV